jgi:AraC family transcriptional regulator
MINYYERMQRSIDYIEEHLRDELDIDTIAKMSFFSVTHYYRIFQATVSDSVKEYIRKRRLSSAAVDLVYTHKRIIDIAFDYQFESQEVFTRAFSKLFNVTPGRHRKQKSRVVLYEKVNMYSRSLGDQKVLIKPCIILDKEFKVIGMKSLVKPGDQSIHKLWEDFTKRRHEIKYPITPEVTLGMCEYMPDITEESDFTYITCVEVKDFDDIPKGMTIKTIPYAKYAVFTHKGCLASLKNTYEYIYGTWLPDAGYELAELETIELYDARSYDPDHEDYEFDIFIPLKHLKENTSASKSSDKS